MTNMIDTADGGVIGAESIDLTARAVYLFHSRASAGGSPRDGRWRGPRTQ